MINQKIAQARDQAWKDNCLSIAEITDNNMKTDIIIFDKGFDAGALKYAELLSDGKVFIKEELK